MRPQHKQLLSTMLSEQRRICTRVRTYTRVHVYVPWYVHVYVRTLSPAKVDVSCRVSLPVSRLPCCLVVLAASTLRSSRSPMRKRVRPGSAPGPRDLDDQSTKDTRTIFFSGVEFSVPEKAMGIYFYEKLNVRCSRYFIRCGGGGGGRMGLSREVGA